MFVTQPKRRRMNGVRGRGKEREGRGGARRERERERERGIGRRRLGGKDGGESRGRSTVG